ncbi:MAG: hypothetical protein QXE80_03405 [Pyrobaculum sp.]
MILDDAKVVINDLQKPSDRSEVYTGVIYAIAGQNVLQIPFVIRDGYLYPMDIMYDEATDEIFWLTKPNFYKVIFGEIALGVPASKPPSSAEITFNDTTNSQLARSYPELLDRTGLVYGDAVGKVVVAHITPQGRMRKVDIYEGLEKKASYKVARSDVDKLLELHGLKAPKHVILDGGFVTNTTKVAQFVWLEPTEEEYVVEYLDGTSRKVKTETYRYHLFNKKASIKLDEVLTPESIVVGKTYSIRHGNRVTEPIKIEKLAGDGSAFFGHGLITSIPVFLRFVKTAQQGYLLLPKDGNAVILASPHVELSLHQFKKEAALGDNEVRYFRHPQEPNMFLEKRAGETKTLTASELAIKLAGYGLGKDEIQEVVRVLKTTQSALAVLEPRMEIKTGSLKQLQQDVRKSLKKVAETIEQQAQIANAVPEIKIVTQKLEEQFSAARDVKNLDALVEDIKTLIARLIVIYWNLLIDQNRMIPVESVRNVIDELEKIRDIIEQYVYVQKFEPKQQQAAN